MKILKKLSVLIILLTTVLLVVSCGGGGGGSSATNKAPGGSGSITLDLVTKVISGSFTTTNVVGATAAHIHDGNIGVAGPVVVPLLQSPAGSGIWMVPASTTLTDVQIAKLQAGGYYVNIHTTLNPAGEIRGQLTPDSTTVNKFNATLDQAQEVPAPTNPPVASTGTAGY